jgi:hypothetical protein
VNGSGQAGKLADAKTDRIKTTEVNMMKQPFSLKQFGLLLLLTVLLAGCGMLEVGLEPAPIPVTATTAASATTAATATPAVAQSDATATPAVAVTATDTPATGTFDRVNIFLIAMDDDGRTGKRIGCGDSAVAVELPVAPTSAPLRAALDELLSLPGALYGESGLYNALHQSDLAVAGITIENRKATIQLTGSYLLGGTCDDPRFVAQLEETVLQFNTIDAVDIFINGTSLRDIVNQASPGELYGLQVAYVHDSNIFLWRERAETIQLTTSGGVEEVQMSDDGRYIAFRRGGELWVVDSSGANERRLVSAADFEATAGSGKRLGLNRFQWVPAAYILAFNSREEFDAPGLILSDDLRLVNAITGEQTLLLEPGAGGEFYYSPDGAQIAVVTPGNISLMNTDGSNRRQVLTYTPVLTYSEYQYYAKPVWASDGQELMVVIPPADPLAQPVQNTSLFRLPVDGRPGHLVQSITAHSLYSGPALSPDLRYVAFLQPTGENQYDLRLSRVEGEPIIYARDVQELLGWAPDSEKFIFAHDFSVKQLGRVDSPPRTLIETVVMVTDIRWVDSERFLFFSQSVRGWDLTLGHVDGTTTIITAVAGAPTQYDFAD